MKKTIRVCFFFRMLIIAGLIISCDSDYDLSKEIDGDITIGSNGLAFPLGSTGKIMAEELLNMENENSLKTDENGDFYITMNDEVTPKKFSIPNVAIGSSSPIIKPLNFSNYLTKSSSTSNIIKFAVVEPIQFIVDGVVPKEIMSITSGTFKNDIDENYPTFTISIEISGFPVNLPSIYISNLTIDLPGTMIYAPNSEIIGGKLITTGKIALNNGAGIYTKSIYVVGGKYNNNTSIITDANNDKYLHVNELLDFRGSIVIDPIYGINPDLTAIIGKPSIVFSGANIDVFTGAAEVCIDPIEYIYTTEFPIFMKEQGSYLDLLNASISLNATTNSTVEMVAETHITAYKNNSPSNDTAIDLDLEIKPSTIGGDFVNTNFWVTTRNENTPLSYTWIDRDVSALMRDIPETINITINPKTTQTISSVELGKDYQVKLSYEFLTPLMLGDKLMINYTEDFTNIQENLSGIINKIAELAIDIETNNLVPLDLIITPTPIDISGNLLSGVELTIDGDIKSAEKDNSNKITGTKGVVSNAKLTLKETREGAFKELNTIKLNMKASSSKLTEGAMLNKNQYLILSMKAQLPSGITVNEKK